LSGGDLIRQNGKGRAGKPVGFCCDNFRQKTPTYPGNEHKLLALPDTLSRQTLSPRNSNVNEQTNLAVGKRTLIIPRRPKSPVEVGYVVVRGSVET